MNNKHIRHAAKKTRSLLKHILSLTPKTIAIIIVALVFCTGASALYIHNSYRTDPKSPIGTPAETNLTPVISTLQQSTQQSSTELTTPAPQTTTQAKDTTTSAPSQSNNSTSYESNLEYIKTYQVTCINPMQDLTTTVSSTQVSANQSYRAATQSLDHNYQIGTDYWIASYNNLAYLYNSTLENSWNTYAQGVNSLKQSVSGCAARASYLPYPYTEMVDASGSNYAPYILGSSRSQYP
jgi:hypothetical protein